MIFYLGLVGVLVAFAAVFGPNHRPAAKLAYTTFAFSVLATVAAIRAPTVGDDTLQYVRAYPVIGVQDWNDRDLFRYEPGYTLFNQVLYRIIGDDPRIYIGITNAIILLGLGWFVYKYSPNVPLSITLFVFLLGYADLMNVIRQYLAIVIILLFVPQLLKGRYLRFAIGVTLATQFHISAFILLSLIPLARLRLTRRSVAVATVVAIFGLMLSGQILSLVATQRQSYSNYVAFGETGKLGMALALVCHAAVVAAMAIAFLRSDDDHSGEPSQATFFFWASWAVLPILALSFTSNAYFRLATYTVPFIAVGAPIVLRGVKDRGLRQVLTCMVVLPALIYFAAILTQRPDWHGVVPYTADF